MDQVQRSTFALCTTWLHLSASTRTEDSANNLDVAAGSEINRKDGQEERKCFRNRFTRPQCTKILSTMLQLLLADKTLSYTHNLFLHGWPSGAEGRVFVGFTVRAARSAYTWFDLGYIFFFLLRYILIISAIRIKKTNKHRSHLLSTPWLEAYLIFMGLIVPRKRSPPRYPINLDNRG